MKKLVIPMGTVLQVPQRVLVPLVMPILAVRQVMHQAMLRLALLMMRVL